MELLRTFVYISIIITASADYTLFNSALGKPTAQGSLYAAYTAAGNAVDGDLNSQITQGSCASTAHYDYTPWWRVDLTRRFHVMSVVVTSRHPYGYRLHDFTIRVSMDESSEGMLCGVHPGAVEDGATVSIQCEERVWGRYVTISKPTDDFADILTLCEVQVMVPGRSEVFFMQQVDMINMAAPSKTVEMDLLTCAHTCNDVTNCVSFNYNKATSQCQLFSSSDDTTSDPGSDWMMYNVLIR